MLAAATVGITSGHNTLADILFLVGFILAVIGFVLTIVEKPLALNWLLVFAIFAVFGLAWFVL